MTTYQRTVADFVGLLLGILGSLILLWLLLVPASVGAQTCTGTGTVVTCATATHVTTPRPSPADAAAILARLPQPELSATILQERRVAEDLARLRAIGRVEASQAPRRAEPARADLFTSTVETMTRPLGSPGQYHYAPAIPMPWGGFLYPNGSLTSPEKGAR